MTKFSPFTTLKLQPGSRFTTTREGFDTGTRTFVCDKAEAARLEPELDSPDSTYKRMYVEAVQSEDIGAQLTRMTVTYLGIKKPGRYRKPPRYEVSYSVQVVNESGTTEGGIGFRDGKFDRVLPVVTVTYVTGAAPDQAEVNSKKEPAKFASVNKKPYFAGLTTGSFTVWEGWMLTGRSIREAGPLYEVRDTYSYVIHEAKRLA